MPYTHRWISAQTGRPVPTYNRRLCISNHHHGSRNTQKHLMMLSNHIQNIKHYVKQHYRQLHRCIYEQIMLAHSHSNWPKYTNSNFCCFGITIALAGDGREYYSSILFQSTQHSKTTTEMFITTIALPSCESGEKPPLYVDQH